MLEKNKKKNVPGENPTLHYLKKSYSPILGEKVSFFKVDTYSSNIGEYVYTLKLLCSSCRNVTSFKVYTYSPILGKK